MATLVLKKEVSPEILCLTLNDPEALNAMSEEMAAAFAQTVEDLRSQKAPPRVIILSGAGRAFSAGGNLEMLRAKAGLSPIENERRMNAFYTSFLTIRELNIPLIAAINGHAVGAGLCVAAACDIRVAAEGAKLGFTFTKLGLHPGMGATFLLPQIVGYASAVELLVTGKMVDASEALRLGLVSRVVPGGTVLDAAIEIGKEILQCGPESVAQLLSTLRAGSSSLRESLQREALAQSFSYASKEFLEGVTAAIEKRPPVWAPQKKS